MDFINILLSDDSKTRINEAITNILEIYDIPLNFVGVDDAFMKIRIFLKKSGNIRTLNNSIFELTKIFLSKYLRENINLCVAIFLKLNTKNNNDNFDFLIWLVDLDYGRPAAHVPDDTLKDLINFYEFDVSKLNLMEFNKHYLRILIRNKYHNGRYTKAAVKKP